MMQDAFRLPDKAIYRALAGGSHPSAPLLHAPPTCHWRAGSRDQAQVPRQPVTHAVPGAAALDQVASGENPKRVTAAAMNSPPPAWGTSPSAGCFVQAQGLHAVLGRLTTPSSRGATKMVPRPKRDLKLEALSDVLARQNSSPDPLLSRRPEFLTEIAIAKEFGYKIRRPSIMPSKPTRFRKAGRGNIGIAPRRLWGFSRKPGMRSPGTRSCHLRKKACAQRSRATPTISPGA